MLTYESVVWGLFRAIDSLILIALAYWVCKRKVLPLIRKEIVDEQQAEAISQQLLHDLQNQAGQLDKQLADDGHDIERLEQKIRLWQQAIKRKQVRDQIEKEDILVRLHKQQETKEHALRHQKFYASALLQAVDKAEDVLMQDAFQRSAADSDATVQKLLQYMAAEKEPR
jgi:ABC-type nickel/cobalt efflux system permease component RcnA